MVELLEARGGCESSRLAHELVALGLGASSDPRLARLSEVERAEVSDFVDFLAARNRQGVRPRRRLTSGPTQS